jgi:hypothetical protein
MQPLKRMQLCSLGGQRFIHLVDLGLQLCSKVAFASNLEARRASFSMSARMRANSACCCSNVC